jgi:hypothetical protein
MKQTTVLVIVTLCIIIAFGTSYAVINNLNEEMTSLKTQYENELSTLNSQLIQKENELKIKNSEINSLNDKLEGIENDLIYNLNKFNGTWELTDGDPNYFYSSMNIENGENFYKQIDLVLESKIIRTYFTKISEGKIITFELDGFEELNYPTEYGYYFNDDDHLRVGISHGDDFLYANYTRIS